MSQSSQLHPRRGRYNRVDAVENQVNGVNFTAAAVEMASGWQTRVQFVLGNEWIHMLALGKNPHLVLTMIRNKGTIKTSGNTIVTNSTGSILQKPHIR